MFVLPRFAWSFLSTEIERTNFDSTAKEFILGLFDPGAFSIDVDQDNSDAGQLALMTALVTGAAKSFKLLLPNGNTATFTAYVKKFNSQGAGDQAIRRSGARLSCGFPALFLGRRGWIEGRDGVQRKSALCEPKRTSRKVFASGLA